MSSVSLTFREIMYGFQSDEQYVCIRVVIDGTNWGADIVINHPIDKPEQLSNLYDVEYGDNLSNQSFEMLDDEDEQYDMLMAHFNVSAIIDVDTYIYNCVKSKYADAYYEELKKDPDWIY